MDRVAHTLQVRPHGVQKPSPRVLVRDQCPERRKLLEVPIEQIHHLRNVRIEHRMQFRDVGGLHLVGGGELQEGRKLGISHPHPVGEGVIGCQGVRRDAVQGLSH